MGNPATSDNQTFTMIPIAFEASEPCPVKSNGSCSASLMPNTTYQLKVTTTNRDFAGNSLKNETTQNFTTKGSPKLLSRIPDNTLERWSLSTQPYLTFDQNLDASTIDNKSVVLSPTPPEGYDVQLQDKTIKILPKAPLQNNTSYTVSLDEDKIAASGEGILITDNQSFDFKTKLANKQRLRQLMCLTFSSFVFKS